MEGSDLLLVETFFDTMNAKRLSWAYSKCYGRKKCFTPSNDQWNNYWCKWTNLVGTNCRSISEFSFTCQPLLSIGLNCALGAKRNAPTSRNSPRKLRFMSVRIRMQDLPNQFGEYDETPDHMGHAIEVSKIGFLNIVGGCCVQHRIISGRSRK